MVAKSLQVIMHELWDHRWTPSLAGPWGEWWLGWSALKVGGSGGS